MNRTLPVIVALILALGAGSARANEAPFTAAARVVVAQHGGALLTLARRTLREVVDRGVLDPGTGLEPRLETPAPFGVFVTLVKTGVVRGCYGSMEPQGKSLERLVVEAAVGAARFDPRSRPVRQKELDELQIILSFVGPTVPILTTSELDVKRHGLLVRSGERRSVLLPGEARTATWSLARNLRQAGIRRGEPYEMFRFRTMTLYEDVGPRAAPRPTTTPKSIHPKHYRAPPTTAGRRPRHHP